jgi:hypothetical protein
MASTDLASITSEISNIRVRGSKEPIRLWSIAPAAN